MCCAVLSVVLWARACLRFQLAYYRLYGELRTTYETVMTKMYDHGRTEAQRSCTPEVCVPFRVSLCVCVWSLFLRCVCVPFRRCTPL